MKWCDCLLTLVAMATLIDTSNAGVVRRAKREDDAELALRDIQDEFKKRREETPVQGSVMSSLEERLSRLIEKLEGLKQMKREQEEDLDETRAMEKEEEIEAAEQEEEMRAMEEMEDIEAAEQEEEIRAMEEEEEKEAAEQEEAMRAMEEEEEKEAAEQEEEARDLEEGEGDIEVAEQEKRGRGMFGGGNNLEKQLFNLKFAAKNLRRSAQKSDKMEKMEKTKLKKAIQKHNMEGARIHAENSIRQHKQSLHFLRLSSRIDAVAQRVQTAVTMKKVTGDMSRVVKSMDSALKSMDLEKVAAMMDKFERQFEDLDVQSAQMEGAMSGTTTLNVPKAQVDKLMQQVADEHGLKLNI
ncbi:golgin subfamily A member 6-like protein 22 isoform X2 [Branchiostoma floridae]|uniref:Golgin subfamily A member 6-like protein 22 isoform X2 n=1 Tax=Branchiostoma floridae TaxID=7739 RepID=A0A9J7KSI9_BRAFL|nr:golgin subfamily A member 6-like protein 22 isoform X2 [Branchiostoma floridae]